MKASDIIKTDPTLADALDHLLGQTAAISLQTAETIFDRLTEAQSWRKGILATIVDVHGDKIKVGFQSGNTALDKAVTQPLREALAMFSANITFGGGPAFNELCGEIKGTDYGSLVTKNNNGSGLDAEIKTLQIFLRRLGARDTVLSYSIPLAPTLRL